MFSIKKLDAFPMKTYDKIRYSDTDRQGHVNNAVFSQFLETGRVEILYSSQKPLLKENASFVIANLHIDLLAELTWPGIVHIGTGIIKVGNSSVTIAQGLFQNEKLVAKAVTVVVQINNDSKKSTGLSEDAKAYLLSIAI